MIEVITPGPLATVQDRGRSGYAHLGVGRSGAFDRGAAALGNRLVGNHPSAAVIEALAGGLVITVHGAATVALTGARCTGDLDWGLATSVPDGATIALGPAVEGLRAYLAIRGGFDVAPTLGSRSTDFLGRLGPEPLRAGDRLPVGELINADVDGAQAVPAVAPAALRVVLGPRSDWFTPSAVATFLETVWSVRTESDRIGVRLDGPVLDRITTGELPSEATLPGALQVPPDGRPILLGPDAPVTGGYPVIAVVRDADLDRAAQLRPGDPIAFRV